MNKYNDTKNPILIIIRGLPGSGKSSIANELIDNYPSFSKPIILLDPDRLDDKSIKYQEFTEKLKIENIDSKLFPYRFLRNSAYENIKLGGTTIWTQAFTNLDILDRTIKNLEKYSSESEYILEVLVIEVEVEESIARDRIKQREELGEHGVDDDNFMRFINDYQTFKSYGYETLTVDGNKKVQTSVQKIINKLNNL